MDARSTVRGWGRITLPVVAILVLLTISGIPGPARETSGAPSTSTDLPGGVLSSPTVVPHALSCQGVTWRSANLSVTSDGCQASFFVMYALTQQFGQNFAAEQFNFSFGIPWVAELTPGGSLVRIAQPLSPFSDSSSVTSTASEVSATVQEGVNVTAASGRWTPNDTWAGTGEQWNISPLVLGTTTISFVFHLWNASGGAVSNLTRNDSYGLKFDIGIEGWPWASTADRLGFGLDSLAAGEARFVYDAPNASLEEVWNSTGVPYATLEFGPTAAATGTQRPATNVSVTPDVGLFPGGSPDRRSITLVTFGPGSGGCSNLSYDPWILFMPPPTQPAGGSLFELGGAAVAALVIAVPLGAAVATITVVRWNYRHLRVEGEELVEGMKRVAARDREDAEPHRR